jgi:hypothetical protein
MNPGLKAGAILGRAAGAPTVTAFGNEPDRHGRKQERRRKTEVSCLPAFLIRKPPPGWCICLIG